MTFARARYQIVISGAGTIASALNVCFWQAVSTIRADWFRFTKNLIPLREPAIHGEAFTLKVLQWIALVLSRKRSIVFSHNDATLVAAWTNQLGACNSRHDFISWVNAIPTGGWVVFSVTLSSCGWHVDKCIGSQYLNRSALDLLHYLTALFYQPH